MATDLAHEGAVAAERAAGTEAVVPRASGMAGGIAGGMTVARRFVPAGVNPYDEVEWELRSALIQGENGDVVFEQRDVEVPRTWSQLATNVVV